MGTQTILANVKVGDIINWRVGEHGNIGLPVESILDDKSGHIVFTSVPDNVRPNKTHGHGEQYTRKGWFSDNVLIMTPLAGS